ncbi:Uncharacterised protein [Yersinia rohdei]|uniref:Uncharacterized protein n=1 Tax=Yersinia rohdei TaxID=29485 RepID=A0A0U1HUM2_YERRO|nr:hypothetical protein [Yersinia rohdei]CQI92521.1 Uncharacterised protein [Yersinia rohdei]
MKKLKFDFRLSHILFFFLGVMVTVVLLWVLYKDPTRITAPALTALTTMCTFLLALWSAFKVNKWLNSKVNDAAFKQTEKILESISKIHFSSRVILDDCNLISESDLISAIHSRIESINERAKEALHDKSKSIGKHTQICNEMNLQLQILTYELPMWNIKLKNEEMKINILNIITSAVKFIDHCDKLKRKTNEKDLHHAMSISREIINHYHPILVEHINSIVTKQYEEIFEPVTSPSKKVSE